MECSVEDKPEKPNSILKDSHLSHATEYSVHVFGAIEFLIADRTGVRSNPKEDSDKGVQVCIRQKLSQTGHLEAR